MRARTWADIILYADTKYVHPFVKLKISLFEKNVWICCCYRRRSSSSGNYLKRKKHSNLNGIYDVSEDLNAISSVFNVSLIYSWNSFYLIAIIKFIGSAAEKKWEERRYHVSYLSRAINTHRVKNKDCTLYNVHI